jgi:hypothetical protein
VGHKVMVQTHSFLRLDSHVTRGSSFIDTHYPQLSSINFSVLHSHSRCVV